MKLGIIGKFPPIQGGVSMRTYWCAHELAKRGHAIHVVTNAKEVKSPYRIFMGDRDWARCEAHYESGGYVKVHWTPLPSKADYHIPWHNPFVTKLATTAATVALENELDLFFSYYLEPYAVAGHLAAEMCQLPHVIRHAGSDAGSLWLQPHFDLVYDHIFRQADAIISGPPICEQLNKIGVDARRIIFLPEFRLPSDLFCPHGDKLKVSELLSALQTNGHDYNELGFEEVVSSEHLVVGIYGKPGASKGTIPLLHAFAQVVNYHPNSRLIILGEGLENVQMKIANTINELHLNQFVLQLPFLPHWRIPEFLRLCNIVCCLEQDFHIKFHTPIIAREVLACGRCLVASSEITNKIPTRESESSEAYFSLTDATDDDAIAKLLIKLLSDEHLCSSVAEQGQLLSQKIEGSMRFPENYEDLFTAIIQSKRS